ncbi:MAG TPA: pentapeptide repeat-containing protein [Aquella sp.]|nr:pentapeptide repeat-containing protein [Aquella sp.]
MKIYNRFDSTKVVLDYPSDSLVSANLCNADLNYANLYNADLRYANLYNADLSYAYLYNADLRNANLCNADLSYADLYNADLSYANLYNADLYNADLHNANLYNADLHNVKLDNTVINWQSHDLLAEILRQNAKEEVEFAMAGHILIRRDLCWDKLFLSTWITQDNLDWALKTFSKYIIEIDSHPKILDKYV